MDKHGITEGILRFTLEILRLVTGEDYTVVKKCSNRSTDRSHSHEPVGETRTQSPIMETPPQSLIHDKCNDQKILELTNKIIQLLTGEVPIRCQDVTVCFSMEEWEYIEGHKGIYKDVLMEDRSSVTSADGSSDSQVPKRSDTVDSAAGCVNETQHHSPKLSPTDTEAAPVKEVSVISFDRHPTDVNRSASGNEETGCPTFTPEEDSVSCQEKLNVSEIVLPDRYTPEAELENPNLHEIEESGLVKCKLCGQKFENKSAFTAHYKTHAAPSSFICPFCGKCFSDHSTFALHQKSHTGEKLYACSECDKSYTRSSHLARHRRIHTGAKPFSCPECGQGFPDKASVIKHQMVHAEEQPFGPSEGEAPLSEESQLLQDTQAEQKPFSCPECGKGFARSSLLMRHQRTHTGEQPYSCFDCGKRFAFKVNLVTHTRVHARDRPYFCPECGKIFVFKSQLINHQRIHTGEKPYACTYCDVSFSNKANLASHLRTHTGEKPFPCTECDKSFSRRSHLFSHLNTHNTLQYVCDKCGKKFKFLGHLDRHLKSHD